MATVESVRAAAQQAAVRVTLQGVLASFALCGAPLVQCGAETQSTPGTVIVSVSQIKKGKCPKSEY